MITSEKGVWDHLRPKLKPHGHFCRVETGAAIVGFPDVSYCISAEQGAMELKHCKTIIPEFTLRASQHRWMADRIKAGAHHVWILAYHQAKEHWMLIHGGFSRQLIENPTKWEEYAAYTWNGSIRIQELLDILGEH